MSLDRIRIGFLANRSTDSVPDFTLFFSDALPQRGLEVEYIDFSGTGADTGLTALVAGRIDMLGNATMGGGISIVAAGQEVVGVFPSIAVPYHMVISKDDIATWEDLRGKTIGISSVTDSSYWSLALVLQKYGIDPSEITFTTVRGSSGRAAALSAGAIDAGLVVIGLGLPLLENEDLGLHVLGLTGTELPEIQFAAYWTTRDFIERHPDVIQAVAEEHLKLQRLALDRDSFLAMAEPILAGIEDPDVIAATYETLAAMGVWQANFDVWNEIAGDFTAQTLFEFGVLDTYVPFSEFATTEFTSNAVENLGPLP